jgi:hypothetical protein
MHLREETRLSQRELTKTDETLPASPPCKKDLERAERRSVKAKGFETATLCRNLSKDARLKALPAAQRFTLMYAALNYADAEGKFWPSVDTLAKGACVSHWTAERALRLAVKKKLVERRPHAQPNGRQGSSTYVFDESLLAGGALKQKPTTLELTTNTREEKTKSQAVALDGASLTEIPAQSPFSSPSNQEFENVHGGRNLPVPPRNDGVAETTHPDSDVLITKLLASPDFFDQARAHELMRERTPGDAENPPRREPDARDWDEIRRKGQERRAALLAATENHPDFLAEALAISTEHGMGWDEHETRLVLEASRTHVPEHHIANALTKLRDSDITRSRATSPKYIFDLVARGRPDLYQKLLSDFDALMERGAA